MEHLASLRAMPNLLVMRPADAVEVTECWMAALMQWDRPTVLCLSRQDVPTVRHPGPRENLCLNGAYELRPSSLGAAEVTLLATGSEVHLALQAQDLLEAQFIATRVVSMPCWELFLEQCPTYQQEVLGPGTLKIAIEAASSFGWERFVPSKDHVIGLDRFGASAPAHQLYEHFGITPQHIVHRVQTLKETKKS
jgi:transketolase